jgi:hypothetical protein
MRWRDYRPVLLRSQTQDLNEISEGVMRRS